MLNRRPREGHTQARSGYVGAVCGTFGGRVPVTKTHRTVGAFGSAVNSGGMMMFAERHCRRTHAVVVACARWGPQSCRTQPQAARVEIRAAMFDSKCIPRSVHYL